MMLLYRRDKSNRSLAYTIALLLQAVIMNCTVYFGGRMIGRKLPHHCFVTWIDEAIPLLPWTILIYWGGMVFWAVNYYLGSRNRSNGPSRMIMAHVIGEAVCFLAFVFLPTTMPRHEITGMSLFDRALRLTYRFDCPDNLLPSIHCFVSWLCWIEVRRNPRVPAWYQHFSLCMAIAVCVSTLTVKQHVLVDVAAGILLAEGSYYFTERIILKKNEL